MKTRYAPRAFSGEGARLFGGRWNSPGRPVIYTSESRALAALELLVHLDSPQILSNFVVFGVEFGDSMISDVMPENLPPDWRSDPIPVTTQRVGDGWIARAESPILRVPSALIPEESNYLINPEHQDFAGIRIQNPVAFTFDARLGQSR